MDSENRVGIHRFLWRLCCVWLGASSAFAGPVPLVLEEEPPAPDEFYDFPSFEENEETRFEMLDWSRDRLADYIEGINDGLDTFFAETLFGDDVIDDESSGSNGRVFFTSRRVLGEKSVDYQSGVNIKLALPNTNDRLKLLVETEEDDDESKESDVLGTTKNVTYATALRVQLSRNERWKVTWDNGVSWQGEPVPFSRIRARRIQYFELWHTRFFQSLYYRTNEGWGEKASYVAIRPIDLTKHFNFTLNASYKLNDDFIKLTNSYSVFHELDSRSVIVYRFSINGDSEGTEKFTSYTLSTGYRQEIYGGFVFMDLVPEVSWPYGRNFEPTPGITFNLEMIFGPE